MFEFIFKSNPLSLGPVIAAWPCFKRWQAAVKRDGQLELALGIMQSDGKMNPANVPLGNCFM